MLKVFPNPYHHLDEKDRLAGACPEGEAFTPNRADTQVLRRFVGAQLVMVEGTYKPDSTDGRFLASAETFWQFGSEPVQVDDRGMLANYWMKAIQSEEVFALVKDDDGKESIPMELLAQARIKAIADHVAGYHEKPSTETWVDQFALDKSVAEVAEAIEAKAAEAAKKAEEEAKAKAEAQATKEREAAEKKASDEAEEKRRMTVPDLTPVPTVPTTTSPAPAVTETKKPKTGGKDA